jgi:hypothetical protein
LLAHFLACGLLALKLLLQSIHVSTREQMRPSGRTRQPSGEQISGSKREYEKETGGEPRYAQRG